MKLLGWLRSRKREEGYGYIGEYFSFLGVVREIEFVKGVLGEMSER